MQNKILNGSKIHAKVITKLYGNWYLYYEYVFILKYVKIISYRKDKQTKKPMKKKNNDKYETDIFLSYANKYF